MRRLTVVISVAAVTLSSIATVATVTRATAAPSTPRAGSIAWKSCSDPGLKQLHAQCGYLTVPLDYHHPRGATIKVAVSRVMHTSSAADYQGIALSNPGGPGGSGLTLNGFFAQTLKQENLTHGAAASGDYDWIGFDPRGVGSSLPAISCDPNYFSYDRPAYTPSTPALLRTWLSRSKAYANACRKNGAILNHMTTEDVARDVDSIRAALGQSQITYYGFSYGTYLGQVYATMFPTHVRRMVLDSNVDPRTVWYNANIDQDYAFNRNIDIWFAWVAKYNKVYHLGGTEKAVQNLYYSELPKLAAHPAGGKIGPDELGDALLQAGYYEQTWVQVAQAWAKLVHKGDIRDIKSIYDSSQTPGNDNSFAVYNAVQCTDTQWPLSWAKWAKDNWAANAKSPFLTWGNAWFNAPCLYWPARAHTPVTISGGQAPPILLIDETLDAATPFSGSLYTRSLFPSSVLLAEPGGTTHADSLSGDTCVDNVAATYLATGQLPPRKPGGGPDITCKPIPIPHP
ncbi:MAG TPA: alpha/beta hydrolase [Streptosporangiaceae bacterium]|nr:alpha/beta hydrolase [Streptosporangiaceae bacterium]